MTVKIPMTAAGIIMAGSVGRQTIGSLGSSEDSTNGSLRKPTFTERHPKVVRSLTVVAYIFSVSLAAIVLSAYYVVLWSPKPLKPGENMNATLPCRGVTYLPEGVEVQLQGQPISRLTFSRIGAVRQEQTRPLSGTSPQPQAAVIPVPNKLASNNSQSNSNTSLQEESYVVDDFSEVSTNTSGKQQQTSVFNEGIKHQGATVHPSPALGDTKVTRTHPGRVMKRKGRR
ncbi:unnamed protein product [Orchesella dallaii]|uniref:InaF motif containing 2 n=1 Tax=Orchesella dallaii TaxID=48710 RepID=A0ABP1QXT8_9HEXA